MYRALTFLTLLVGMAPAAAQDASTDVSAELRRIERLPTVAARTQASAVLARKPGVDVDSVVAAIRIEDGSGLWLAELPGPVVKGGTAINHKGQVFVSLENGQILAFEAAR